MTTILKEGSAVAVVEVFQPPMSAVNRTKPGGRLMVCIKYNLKIVLKIKDTFELKN